MGKSGNGEHRGHAEELILQAALQIVVHEGYQGTKMAEVARVSGLPIGSLYWHFKNKEELFSALIEFCFEEWQTRHQAESNRELLFESIARAAAQSQTNSATEKAFWVIGLILALERRLEGNAARKKYLEVREKMFTSMVQTVHESLPKKAVAADPELARKVVTLGRALTNGFYISAAAGDDVDFTEAAELAAQAADAIVQHALDTADRREWVAP